MELTFVCPNCSAVGRIPAIEDAYQAPCAVCGATRALHRSASAECGLSACVWCATEDLYIQKDFPHNLGLGIVLVGFAVSTIFWALYQPVPAFAALLATAAVDVVLYYLVPDVTICYRCLAQHRGPGTNPADGPGASPRRFAPFDLAIGERYRQERIRAEELRSARSGPAS